MEPKIKDITSKAEDLSKKIGELREEKTIPAIELDIILSGIRALYEDLKALQAGSSRNVSSTLPGTAEVPEKETQPEEFPKTEDQSPGSPKAQVPPVEMLQAGVPPEEVPGKLPEHSTLGDRYKGEKKFINESLGVNIQKKDIGSKIQSKPIKNIGNAMGINDRFKLIKDLFNGDKDSYQNTVGILDGAANFNEAFNYITSSFDWDMEEESVQLLLELVRRKFIVNQDE